MAGTPAFVHGSFWRNEEILETIELIPKLIDAIRIGGRTPIQLETEEVLKVLCNDLTHLTTLRPRLPLNRLVTDLLRAESARCLSTARQFYTKISPSQSILQRLWNSNYEGTELGTFKGQLVEHQGALRLLVDLISFNLAQADISAITKRLDTLFHDEKESYTIFLAQRDASAQQLLDMLQDLLDYDDLSVVTRHRLVKALVRLSGESKLHPRCCTLVGLEMGEHLGGGTFSDVFRGVLHGQHVAVKMMRVFGKRNINEVLKEFGREALIWRQLSHPNLLPFFGLYFFDNRLCLVSPWMMNGDIRTFMKNETFSADRLLSFILDVALGLEYLHKQSVAHGDLKAENIFVTPSLRACIADFGLSSVITTISSIQFTDSSKRARGGTVRYQAPELHLEGGRNTLASDIYAFACVAQELLTGKPPFPELRTDASVADAVLRGHRPSRPTSCSGTPALDDLWNLLQACWKEAPEVRPTAGQIVERLMGTVIEAKTTQSTTDWDQTFTSKFRRSLLGPLSLPSVPDIERMILGLESDRN